MTEILAAAAQMPPMLTHTLAVLAGAGLTLIAVAAIDRFTGGDE